MWKNPVRHICVQNSCRYLEKWTGFGEKGQKDHFHAVPCNFCIFPILKICPIWAILKVFYGLFAFLTKKWPENMYHAAQTPNFKFDLSLTSWPWMTLTFNMLTESLGWYLEVSQTRSMSLYWLISISYGSSVRQNQIHQIVKHFDFDLTCDVISDPEVNNIRFTSTNSPDLSNAIWIL